MWRLFFLLGLCVFFAACGGTRHAAKTDQSVIDALILDSDYRFNQCYSEFERRFESTEGGEIHLRADYLPNGNFANTRPIKSFSGAGPLIHCLSSVVNSWTASPPYARGPVDIRIRYEPRSPQQEAEVLSSEEIHQVMDGSSDDFRHCYREAKKTDSEVAGGDLSFQFEVLTSGRVARLREISGFRGSELIFDCLQSKVQNWKFPESRDNTTVTWRWSFAEVGPSDRLSD